VSARKASQTPFPWDAEAKEELRCFGDAFRSMAPLPGTPYEAELAEAVASLSLILESKVLFEVESDFALPLVVVVTGGTNVGKSEVFNALIGSPVALPDPRAGMTRNPAIFVHATLEPRLSTPLFLPGAEKEILRARASLNADEPGELLRAFLWPHETESWRDVALVDSPDIDSNRKGNQSWAKRLEAVSDFVVFVTSPSKYNDEACVAFLESLLALGKGIVVVFNLLGDVGAPVVEDFRRSVWKGLTSEPLTLLELPLAPSDVGKAIAAPLKKLRRRFQKAALGAPAVKRERTAAVFAHFADGAGDVLEALEKEDRAVEEVRRRLGDEVGKGKEAYRRRTEEQEFYELESVFREVLKVFRVPVLDDVLGAPRVAFAWVRARISGSGGGSSLEAKIQARRNADLQWIKENVETARLGLLRDLAGPEKTDVTEVLGARLKDAGFDEAPHARVESLAREGDAEIEAWVRATQDEIVAAIESHPILKKFLKSARVLLQVGAGVLVAVLTGGFGSADLVLGPAAATFAHYFLEVFGSAYFNDKRRAFNDLQVKKYDRIARATVLEPFEEARPRRPAGHDPRAVKEGLESLAKRFERDG